MTGVDALRRYAPGAPPWHAGEGAAALASLQESRRQRLGRLAALLRSFGIDLPLALSSAGPGSLVSILDAWCDAEWPDLAVRDFAWPPRWYARTWQPIEAARHYTLIADVGLALGEWAIRRQPTLTWGVDCYPAHEADGVASFGRVVVLDPAIALDDPRPPCYDALDQAFMRYQSIAFADHAPGHFLRGMRPLLWAAHRKLFVDAPST
jgi:hypothetical protein